jgi:predicted DCC family thiol-disulfide oxidoreductase YuxK
MEEPKHIILFDGTCNFCSFWVKFVVKRDRKDVFRFASLQSDVGQKLLSKYNLGVDLGTVVLIIGNQVKLKSTAALHILYCLGGMFSLGIIFMVIPKTVRDGIYDFIAKNRKRLLKSESCIIPDEMIKSKFIG